MAPHWKCGSGQPVAGSNPALSATAPRWRPWPRCACAPRSRTLRCARSGARTPPCQGPSIPTGVVIRADAHDDVIRPRSSPLEIGTFRFPANEPLAGEAGRRRWRMPSGIAGAAAVRYRVRVRQRRARCATTRRSPASPTSLRRSGSPSTRSTPSSTATSMPTTPARTPLPGHPDLCPAGRVGDRPHDRAHDPRLDRLPDAPYEQHRGRSRPCEGIRVVATPGHTPGHQSLASRRPTG